MRAKTAILYVRRSTSRQALSVERQRVACEEWAQREGYTVAMTCVEEPTSGSTAIDKRPGLCEALAAIDDGIGTVLLVDERSRLARDTYMAGAIGYEVRRGGGEIVSADGCGNGDSESAIIQRTFEDLLAMLERRRIKRRTRRALAVLKAAGRKIGHIPPYGWRHEDGKLAVAPLEQEVREEILALRAAGASYRAISAALGKRGLRSGTQAWHPGQVRRVVRFNPGGTRE